MYDVILITSEIHEDHPLCPTGVIARGIEAKGYSVKVYVRPDFRKIERPRLCYCVTSGSVDSMVNNYTPLKKKRAFDDHSRMHEMPNRAVIYYCNMIKQKDKETPIIIGGIEASLRRFGHYDYWDNKIRKSILLDSRADILVYGNGEKQIIDILDKLKKKENLEGIKGTCILSKDLPDNFEVLPKFYELENKKKFMRSHTQFNNHKDLAQEYDNNYVLQYEYPEYTTEDLDWIYSLGYTRKLDPNSLLKMARFSVVTHRGCIGNCSFCSIQLHQGKRIISRSEKSILKEIKEITKHPEFKGYIDDLGGPSANMYGMDCGNGCDNCMNCHKLDRSHKKIISLLSKASKVVGVKKVFVRSGVRYDLALSSKEYIKELKKHISGCLKIAPEHISENVLKLMNKPTEGLDEFIKEFGKGQLRYYFMICHPGDDLKEIRILKDKMKVLRNIEQFQLFTPTPMSISSAMYWTGLDTEYKNIKVIHDYNTKKKMKREILELVN